MVRLSLWGYLTLKGDFRAPENQSKRPYAVVQLRQEDKAGQLWNMVGFQTNLRWGEQKRVFQLILVRRWSLCDWG